MDGMAVRIAVSGLVGIANLCVVGVVAIAIAGRGESVVIALTGLCGTCLGILGTLLLPGGRIPNGNGGSNIVTAGAQVTPGLSPGAVPVQSPNAGSVPPQSPH